MSVISEKIQEILAYAKSRLEESNEAGDVNDMRVRLLGKSGELTSLLRGLKDIPPEERPGVGKLVNEADRKSVV